MKLEIVNLRLPDVEDLNHGLIEIAQMIIEPEVNMDLGLIHSDIEEVVKTGQKVKKDIALNMMHDMGLNLQEKISNALQEKLNSKIQKALDEFDESKTYKLEVPVFTKNELKKWVKRDADNNSDRAFKPSSIFYKNIKKFIVDDLDSFSIEYSEKQPELFQEA